MNTDFIEQAAERAGGYDFPKIAGILSAQLITANCKIEVVRDRLRAAIDANESDRLVSVKAMVEFLS